jgi:hypothetical protein
MVHKLSNIWSKYTVLVISLQLLLPALASAEDMALHYDGRTTELSVENKMQLAGLLTRLEKNQQLKLHLAAINPQRAGDHGQGKERLDWVSAFFRERNLDLAPRVKSTTFLYTQNDNPSVIVSW